MYLQNVFKHSERASQRNVDVRHVNYHVFEITKHIFLAADDDEISFDPDDIINNIEMVSYNHTFVTADL